MPHTSKTTRKTFRKSALAMAAMLVFSFGPGQEAQAATCTWNPLTGNWNSAASWSCGIVPTGGPDTALIGVGRAVTINTAQSVLNLSNAGTINIDAFLLSLTGGGSTTNTGTINVGAGPNPNNAALQLAAGHNLNNTGGVINIRPDSVLNQFGSTITGGVINTTGTGALVAFNNNNNFLDAVTLNGTLNMLNTSVQRIVNGFTLNGEAQINANSVMSFGGNQTLSGTGSVVFGDSGGGNRLSMQGDTELTIGTGMTVRGQNGTIGQAYLAGGTQTLVNRGRIAADVAGGTITIMPSQGTTNFGVLEAKNGGTLVLSSNVDGKAGSSISAGTGSTVLQNGVELSGTINTTGSGSFRVANSNSNFLRGVTLNGVLDMASGTSIERVTGGLVLNGSVNINANSALTFEGTQTLSGNGTLVLGDSGGGNRALSMTGDTVLTVGPNIVVRGQNGTLGQAYLAGGNQSLVNQGKISADVSGGTLHLSPSQGTTNFGVLEARNGGTLVLNSTVEGKAGSSIFAGAGSTVRQNGVALSGTINTSGNGNFLVANSNANFLNGVTFNGVMDMATGTSVQRVTGGLVLNGAINLNANSVITFEGTQALTGNGTLVLGDSGGGNRALSMTGDTALTIGPNIVVRGQNGTVGQAYLAGGTQTLVNQGRISADVAGGSLSLAPSQGTSNFGVLEAQNGGTLVLNSTVAGQPGGSIVAGAGSTVVQNGVFLSGVINSSGSGNFLVSNSNANFLDGVTFNGPLDMATGTSVERVVNGLTLNGTIKINANSVLTFGGDQSLAGIGNIVLGDSGAGNRALSMTGDTVLTVGSGITVSGQNGTVGQAYLAGGNQKIINNGVIHANVGGGTVALAPTLTQNANLLSASNGGTLRLDSAVTQTGAGRIVANDGSAVIQNGVTVTGGAINTTGSGRFVPTNSNSNFIDGITLSGLMDLASGTGLERVTNGLTLNGGVIDLNANSVLTFGGDQTLGGTGSVVLGSSGAGNRALSMTGDTALTVGAGVTVRGVNGTLGQAYLAGGNQQIINLGTFNSDGGGVITVTPTAMINHGLMRAQNGAMNIQAPLSGTGTLQVDATGAVTLANAANTQGRLQMGAAGAALNLGPQNLTITSDYTNEGAGTGNGFNRRAGITGAGKVMASGDVKQVITGSGVSNGNTANATLTLGNVRVGSTTFNYQVGNAGTNGPTLRGALQTNVNGGNLTDARLSGTGVAASNFNAGAPGGNSGNLAVTFTTANSGPLTPMSGQVLNLRSNFENIADQKLNITLAGGASAFTAAVGNATSPVQIANQRVGGSNSALLAVANTAPAGAFSEDLNASFASAAGQATGSGNILGRLAGTGNTGSGSINVGVNTAGAGARTGTVTLNYDTTGTVNGVSNGLGLASVGSQTITVNGNVYQAATGALQGNVLNFGTVQVGQGVSQNLVVRNTATGPNGFVEDLNASFGATSGTGASLISGSGSFSNILAGTNSSVANGVMTVSVNTGSAGVVNGNIAVNYFTAGSVNKVSNGLGTAAAGTEAFGVNGNIQAVVNVINQASPVLNTPTVNLGSVRVGGASPTAFVSMTNQATTAPQAALNASISSNGGAVTAGGSFNLLAPGATSANQLQVGLNTAVAGNFNGSGATVALVSDANNVGGCVPNCQLTLASQQVVVNGKVYAPAAAGLNTTQVNFGIVHVGDSVAGKTVSVTNTAATAGLNDVLRGSLFGSAGGLSASGNLGTGLGAGATNSASLVVNLDTSSAGVFAGNASVAFSSHNDDMADLDLGAQTVAMTGQVNNYAQAAFAKNGGQGSFSGGLNSYLLDFGTLEQGSGAVGAQLSVLNTALGIADLLRGLFDLGTAGQGDNFTLSGFNTFGGVAAGSGFGGLSVNFGTALLGDFSKTIVLRSAGTNASGYDGALGDIELRLHGQIVTTTPVPEPETYLLMALGLVAVGLAKCRAQRANQRAAQSA